MKLVNLMILFFLIGNTYFYNDVWAQENGPYAYLDAQGTIRKVPKNILTSELARDSVVEKFFNDEDACLYNVPENPYYLNISPHSLDQILFFLKNKKIEFDNSVHARRLKEDINECQLKKLNEEIEVYLHQCPSSEELEILDSFSELKKLKIKNSSLYYSILLMHFISQGKEDLARTILLNGKIKSLRTANSLLYGASAGLLDLDESGNEAGMKDDVLKYILVHASEDFLSWLAHHREASYFNNDKEEDIISPVALTLMAQKPLVAEIFLRAGWTLPEKDLVNLFPFGSDHISRQEELMDLIKKNLLPIKFASLLSYKMKIMTRTIVGSHEVRTIQYQGDYFSSSLSPDGKYVMEGSGDKIAKITEVSTGKEIRTIQHQGTVFSSSFSPNGKYVMTGSFDKTAKITEVSTGKVVRTIQHQGEVYSSSFSTDGKYVMTGSYDKTARITEVSTGKVVLTIQHQDKVYSSSFSPNGKYVITGSEDKTGKITEVSTGKVVWAIQKENAVISSSFSPNGKYVVIGSRDRTAQITEVSTGKEIRTIQHQGSVFSSSFSPNGKYVLTGSFDKTAKITEVSTGKEVWDIQHEDAVYDSSFSPDMQYVMTGSKDKKTKVTELIWQED